MHALHAVALLTLAASLSPGCKWVGEREPTPICREGRHPSGGKCCGPGEEWVPARQACLCFQAEACGAVAASARRAGDAAPAAAPAAPPPREAGHPCVGTWKSRTGVELALTIRALEPGSLERPHAAACGVATERTGEGRCSFRLLRCTQNGDLLITTAAASESSECAESSSLVLQCGSREARYRRAEEDRAVRGQLERVTAAVKASGGPPGR